MDVTRKFLFLAGALCLTSSSLAAPSDKPAPTLPVSVSAANYVNAPWDELRRRVGDQAQLNPVSPETQPLSTPQTYVFAPGELYESDVSYEDLCRQLEAALAKKGYRNAANTEGRVARPDKIDLILRLSSGGRQWRNPKVRVENLTWQQGLVNHQRTTRHIGGPHNISFDHYAGGNDDALAGAGAAQSAAAGTGVTDGSQVGALPGLYDSTRDFFLLVVDAFSYKELLEKQSRARREWSTFIALPREDHNSFAAVLPTLLKVATPYFGETTTGLQVFNDARATVKIGELQVIDTDVRAAPGKK